MKKDLSTQDKKKKNRYEEKNTLDFDTIIMHELTIHTFIQILNIYLKIFVSKNMFALLTSNIKLYCNFSYFFYIKQAFV